MKTWPVSVTFFCCKNHQQCASVLLTNLMISNIPELEADTQTFHNDSSKSWELPSVPSFQCFRYKSLIGRYRVTGVGSVRSKMWVWEPGAALSRSALHDIAQCTNMEHTDSHFQHGKSALHFPKQGVSQVRNMHICRSRSKSKLEMNIKEFTACYDHFIICNPT